MEGLPVYDSAIRSASPFVVLRELWEARSVVYVLVSRNLKLRYKRSILGVWWTFLNPLATSAILYVVFSTVFKARLQDGASFAPYLLAGILLNTFFNQGMSMASDSISQGGGVLTKVYVPPQVFAVAATFSAAINFFIGLVPLTLVVYISGQSIAISSPLVAVVALFMTILVTGVGLLTSVLYIRFDDTKNIVSIFLMILTYATPIFYPKSILSPHALAIINLNPLTSFLDIYRWSYTGIGVVTLFDWVYMITSSLAIFFFGSWVFAKTWPKIVGML